MTLSQKILGSGIKLVLYGEGIVRVQVGQACTVCIPHPGQVLSYLGGVWGGASPQVQAARKQAVEAQSRISGKQRVPLPTPTISLLSEP